MMAKQLSYLAGADSAGIVLGARVPIILTSRADSVTSRLASVALARLLSAAAKEEARMSEGRCGRRRQRRLVLPEILGLCEATNAC